ncbi:MAG: Beta-lactamase class C-like and penicillin binding proteins (PBPs) superfamily [Cytophagales bacterium]|jgi:CubicO group peptidase (beta-lactamase class C family)|nr:serine hydrolase [Bacteroidota bacterium]MBS1980207.1 serine hydrolase [Bacteroidota bacterium]WHZ08725.1 MAG: Beta-lactamase class C-like and penicillin binding proteins (PBPs) superfamily [Cytophagales bacterium]
MKYLFAFSICLTTYLVKGQDFETLCKTRVDTEETPGISVGIYENGKTSYYAFGQSNVAAHEAVSSKTFFEIGSITKTFTTSVLSYLVNEKILKLNDPAQNYLPSTITLPDRNGKQITLLHLASAQSGLPRMPSNFAPANPNNPYIDYTSKELAAFLNKCELSTDPGKQYEYSNLGMGLLGFILANQMKTTYSKLIQEIILTPLGMEQTFISGERKFNNLFATGYNDSKPVESWTWTDQSVMVGAGGIVSNAEDMMKYAIAQLSDNPDKLSLAFQQAHAEVADAIGASIQIAMGWHIKDHQYIWHNGGTGGFRSFIGFDPKTKRAIVILTNSTIGADDLGFHWLNNSYPLKKIKTPITIDAAKLKEYDGIYEISPQFKITVKTEGTSLLGQATGQPQFTMHSDSTDRFYLKVVPVSILFSRDKKGKIINLKLRQNGAWMEGKKIN